MSKNAVFIIESGRALEMVKEHIADRQRVRSANQMLAEDLGIEEATTDRRTGVMSGVVFKNTVHPEFKVPKRRDRVSYPKKGSEWEKRFAAQTGWRDPSEWISTEFSIPLSIRYATDGGGHGWSRIGHPLVECGFLFVSSDGPYAIWAPDVPAIVADRLAEREMSIDEPAKSFKFNIDGARRIDREEWDFIVAKHRFNEKQKEAA